MEFKQMSDEVIENLMAEIMKYPKLNVDEIQKTIFYHWFMDKVQEYKQMDSEKIFYRFWIDVCDKFDIEVKSVGRYMTNLMDFICCFTHDEDYPWTFEQVMDMLLGFWQNRDICDELWNGLNEGGDVGEKLKYHMRKYL